MSAPGEAPVLAQLGTAQAELERIATKVAALQERRDNIRDVLRVLAAADDELKDRVRDLLGRLRAQVEPPIEKNKEDGWIHVSVASGVLDGVLEIKSTRSDTFDETGLRQLIEWVSRTKNARGRDYKGIFIGNPAYAKPLAERPDPFSSGFRKSCQTNGFVAVTVATLLRELRRVVDDGADAFQFWEQLFRTRGVLE